MITRKLPCILNDHDILDRGKQLANAEHAYAEIVEQRKVRNDAFKKSLDAIRCRIDDLATAIRDRTETSDVECDVVPEMHTYKNLLVRRDTGEIVESYDMTEQERQGTLL